MGSGSDTQILAAIVDVSERQRAEAEVARARALLYGSVNSAETLAIIATDTDGLITLFSAGAEKCSATRQPRSSAYRLGHPPPAAGNSKRAQQLSAELGRSIDGFATFVTIPLLRGGESREWLYVLRKDGTGAAGKSDHNGDP